MAPSRGPKICVPYECLVSSLIRKSLGNIQTNPHNSYFGVCFFVLCSYTVHFCRCLHDLYVISLPFFAVFALLTLHYGDCKYNASRKLIFRKLVDFSTMFTSSLRP